MRFEQRVHSFLEATQRRVDCACAKRMNIRLINASPPASPIWTTITNVLRTVLTNGQQWPLANRRKRLKYILNSLHRCTLEIESVRSCPVATSRIPSPALRPVGRRYSRNTIYAISCYCIHIIKECTGDGSRAKHPAKHMLNEVVPRLRNTPIIKAAPREGIVSTLVESRCTGHIVGVDIVPAGVFQPHCLVRRCWSVEMALVLVPRLRHGPLNVRKRWLIALTT
eukprot:SAG31_NODE_2530_length_5556_cov_2.442917_4_plen_225_part_00